MRVKYILIVAASLLALASCKGTDPEPEVSAPKLVSTDPADGLTDLESSSLTVQFTFDSPISVPDNCKSRITAGEATVTEISALARYLTITVIGLNPGKTYTISIPDACVFSQKDSKVSAKAVSFTFSTKDKPAVPEWESAAEAVANMGFGWNLGNTLDSNSYDWKGGPGWIVQYTDRRPSDWETAWGQPVTKASLLKMFADAGFGAIRVPVTWAEHFLNDGTIDPAWMDRVEQVVNYVLDTGMYCILNVHHDTGELGWLHADNATYKEVSKKYISLWNQIATRFADYGDHLVFEAFNEMLDGYNRWNTSSAEGYDNINKYNQDFVRTVRATGGNNAVRNLVASIYAASASSEAMNKFAIPTDDVPGHLIAEVHSYAPYRFAFEMANPMDQITVFDAQCDREVRGIVNDINNCLVKRGIPVILGEYGATSKLDEAEMAKQAACYVSEAKKYGIACFYWMTLSDGADRSVPKWTKPLLKDAIISAYNGN